MVGDNGRKIKKILINKWISDLFAFHCNCCAVMDDYDDCELSADVK
jgi:hypothetical protein